MKAAIQEVINYIDSNKQFDANVTLSIIKKQLQKALDNSSPEVSCMKWVKASERLPETSNVTARYIDSKKPFVGDILEFFSFYTQMPFEIEWLDEGK